MANVDGTVKIDTKIDHGGFLKGFQKMSAQSQKLKNSISETTQQIDKLQKELNELQNAPLESTAINNMSAQCDTLDKKLLDLLNKREQLELDTANTMGGIGSAAIPNQASLDSLMQNNKEWQKITAEINKTDAALTKYEKKLEQAKATEQKKRDTAIDKKATAIEKATNKLDVYKTKLAEVQEKESGIGKKLDSISNLAKKGFANMTKSGNKSNGMLDKLNGSVSRFTKRIWGVLSSALVFTVLSKAFTALREKIAATTKQNAQFSASMAVIRGNASSAFNTLITAAMPALNSLMSVIAKATTYLNTFISLLFGKTVKSANAAASATNGQAAALDKAGKAAKKASEYLNAYDEMNVQASDNDSSGGGGGGGSDLTYTEDADVEGQVAKYLDRIKKAWEKADFTEFGTMLGNKINGVLENIDWSGIQTGATKLGKSLATFLNGFFETPGLFSNVGKTIAESLNTAIDASLGFAENFHFDSAGQAIADTVNGFFKTFDFAKLAESINSWVDGLKTMISTAIKGISWSTILKDGLDFLTHLDLDTVIISIAAFKWFFGGKELVADALKTLMATKVQTGIGSSSIPVSAAIDLAITTAIIGFKIGNWIYENTSFSKFADAVAKWMVDENGDVQVDKAIAVTLTGITLSILSAELAAKLATKIIAAATTGTALAEAGLTALPVLVGLAFAFGCFMLGKTLYKSFPSVQNWSDYIVSYFGDLLTGNSIRLDLPVQLGIDATVEDILDTSGLGDIITKIDNALGNPNSWSETGKNIWEGLKKSIEDEADIFIEFCAAPFKGLIDAVKKLFGIHSPSTVFAEIGGYLIEGFKNGITNAMSNISTWIDQHIVSKVTGAMNGIKDFTVNVKASVDDIKQKAAEKWNEAKNWFDDKKYQIAVKIDDIKSKASDLWSNAKDWAKDKALSLGVKFSKSAGDLYNDIKKAWGKVSGKTFSIRVKLNNTAKGLFNSFKTAWGKIKTKLKFPMQMPHISWGTTQKTILGKKISVPSLNVRWYANGGFPDMGQLFIARERGAEMVGNIGGKTAVANNDQITTAIAAAVGPAVYDAMMSAMANGDSGQINLNLELGGQKITDYVIQDVKNRTFASGGRNPILV